MKAPIRAEQLTILPANEASRRTSTRSMASPITRAGAGASGSRSSAGSGGHHAGGAGRPRAPNSTGDIPSACSCEGCAQPRTAGRCGTRSNAAGRLADAAAGARPRRAAVVRRGAGATSRAQGADPRNRRGRDRQRTRTDPHRRTRACVGDGVALGRRLPPRGDERTLRTPPLRGARSRATRSRRSSVGMI